MSFYIASRDSHEVITNCSTAIDAFIQELSGAYWAKGDTFDDIIELAELRCELDGKSVMANYAKEYAYYCNEGKESPVQVIRWWDFYDDKDGPRPRWAEVMLLGMFNTFPALVSRLRKIDFDNMDTETAMMILSGKDYIDSPPDRTHLPKSFTL